MKPLPIFRDRRVQPGFVYLMPQGSHCVDLVTGENVSAAPGVYVHIYDPRTDDEIRAACQFSTDYAFT